MTPEFFDCEQGSPDWFQIRCGLLTASNFGTAQAKGKDGAESLTRKRLLRELAAEIVTGQPIEGYSNGHMERGKLQEGTARDLYAQFHEVELDRVGFIKNGQKGASPDALIGNDGGLEIKTQLAHLQVELLMLDRFPPEHKAQVQGNIWVAEREWWDIAIYSAGLPLWVCRTYRDDAYIKQLSDAVDRFNEELSRIVDRIRGYGKPLSEQLRQSLTQLETML